MAAVVVSVLFC